MTLNNIFAKPIDRPIEGVIKADDEKTLRNEIEEYVITNELEKRLENFFSAYHNYEGANGVWISGFFGSGKSHLLKMLALLLENRSVEDLKVADSFIEKCPDNNQFLAGELKKVISIPAQSILFNIDQKADVISKNQIDALLAVFVKVFDETCGYYGKQGHIAKFERDLDSRGQYEAFKIAYEEISGKPWHFGREQAILESQNIAQAYGRVTDNPPHVAQGVLDKYRSEYKVSIEDFAQQVKEYIDKKPANFRLNFFVDEVGQYIANNVKLMTNLQTIAESLATKCRGRAWIIVTAQEEMDNVIGEQSKQQSNDFSKIQARFANRMKLTSNDVAEVIQKRLLSKNSQGVEILSELYEQQANNFKTLFDFTDGSTTYKNFRDLEHFTATYPFIPYQFDLFQSAIQNLSIHNAFEGKHSSVGERSMLGVFQQVAITIRDYQVGQLATFDLMFEGISSVLKSNTQRAISLAQKNLDNPFAVSLLKVLFLVKYVQPFRSTLRNLTILMLDSFDCNVGQLQKQIQEALNLLEQQTYIQRNGEVYEYLTDEEKDIEQEIKNTDVERDVVNAELAKLLFDYVIKLKKIKSEFHQQEYPFSRRMDNSLYGREYELGIHFITPFNDDAENLEIIKAQAMGRDELFVVIPPDDLLMREVVMYKRTEKYLQQNLNNTDKPIVRNILGQKQNQNSHRYQELQERLRELLVKATFIINGTELDIQGEDVSGLVTKGFQELITKTYLNLSMLRGVVYNESKIRDFIYDTASIAPDNLAESETEVFGYIQSNQRNGLRSTIKDVVNRFGRKPYGWDSWAVVGTIAKLITYGKLEARQEGNLLKSDDLEGALLKSNNYSHVLLEPQIDFSPSQVRNLREFYGEFFHKSPTAGEAKPLAEETKEAFNLLVEEMKAYVGNNFPYPFKDTWLEAIALISPLLTKPYNWFLTDLSKQEDNLLDLKEDVIDPIFTFLNSKQRELFDEAYNFINQEKTNLTYIDYNYYIPVQTILEDAKCFRGKDGQDLKGLLENLKNKLNDEINIEIKKGNDQLQKLKNQLLNYQNFVQLSEEQKQEIISPFTEVNNKLNQSRLIPVIRDTIRSFEENDYTGLLKKVDGWAVGSEEWRVGSGQWEVDSGKWEVGSGERVGSGKWEVGSEKGSNEQLSLIDSPQPPLIRGELMEYMDFVGRDLFTDALQETLRQFEEADNFASLIRPALTDVDGVMARLGEVDVSGQLFFYQTHQKVLQVLDYVRYLSPRYHVVIANPPYLGSKGMNPRLSAWVKDNYPDSKSDLFAMFIERNLELSVKNGYSAMITMQSWMFLSSFEKLRKKILSNQNIENLIQIGYNTFPELNSKVAQGCAFVLINAPNKNSGCYLNLNDASQSADKNKVFLDKKKKNDVYWAYASEFKKIPQNIIAYPISNNIIEIFHTDKTLEDIAPVRQGFQTGNNDIFLKLWHEINYTQIGFNFRDTKSFHNSGKQYAPYNKGGEFRKWYGNNDYVVLFEKESYQLLLKKGNNLPSRHLYFQNSITWSSLTSNLFGARYNGIGYTFSGKGACCFPKDLKAERFVISLLNSCVVAKIFEFLSATLDFNVGSIRKIPLPKNINDVQLNIIFSYASKNIRISMSDWNYDETSWDFTTLPLLEVGSREWRVESKKELHTSHFPLPTHYKALRQQWAEMTLEMQRLEEENNRIFIEAYGLQDELTPQVPLKEITLTCNPYYRYGKEEESGKWKVESGKEEDSGKGEKDQLHTSHSPLHTEQNTSHSPLHTHFPHDEELEKRLLADTMKEFISYSVGCMFGRYSLDKQGLILANQGEGIEDYYRIIGDDKGLGIRDEELAENETLTPNSTTSHSPLPTSHFSPTKTNVIPILDGDWFSDDITAQFRQFLRVTFGDDNYEINLKFIEDAIGKKIGKYFQSDFYNDHIKRYKKRPIYWLFSSPKGSFNALIYLHRYRPDTVSIVLNDYLREYRNKLEGKLEYLKQLEIKADVSVSQKTKAMKEMSQLTKIVSELNDYENKVLYPLATEKLEIDLDDGVKVNYPKFGRALKDIKL